MNLSLVLMLFSTLVWGFAFIAIRWTLTSFDPFWAAAIRFSLAGLLGLPFLFYKKSFWNYRGVLKKAAASSFFLSSTILLQTIGLNYTTVAKSGFITTLYAFFIPLILMVFKNKKYRISFWFLVLMAVFGMGLLCNLETKELNRGDFFVLLCALSGACHVIYIGSVANTVRSPIEFNFLQNFFAGIFCLIIALIFKGPVNLTPLLNFHSEVVLGFGFLSIVSSMIAFSIQVIAQKKIPAHTAGLIFLMESPFAAMFGHFIFHETLSVMNIFGALLIFISVVFVPLFAKEI